MTFRNLSVNTLAATFAGEGPLKVTKFFSELIKPAHKKVVRLYFPFLKANGWILGLWLGSYLSSQMLNQMAAVSANQGPNIILILSVGLIELTVSYFIYLLVPRRAKELLQGLNQSSLNQINRDHAKDLISEQLRVASGVVIGLVMGIIPGLLRMLRWAFVPFIVTTHPDYAKGEVDALKYSEKLTQGLMTSIALLWLLFTLGDVLFYYLEQGNWFGDAEIAVWTWQGVVSLISFIVELYAVLLSYIVYETLRSPEGVKR